MYIYVYIYIIPKRSLLDPLKAYKINMFDLPLDVPGPLETYWLPLCQILTLGNALQPEL